MKRTYIAPVANNINIESEELIAVSNMTISEQEVNTGWSNERQSASSCIWGEE